MVNTTAGVLRLSGAQEIREAAGVREEIIALFATNASIVVDLTPVTEVDLTLIQLLESARVSATQEGKSLSLAAPASGALLAALTRGGFLSEPNDPRTQFWLAA